MIHNFNFKFCYYYLYMTTIPSINNTESDCIHFLKEQYHADLEKKKKTHTIMQSEIICLKKDLYFEKGAHELYETAFLKQKKENQILKAQLDSKKKKYTTSTLFHKLDYTENYQQEIDKQVSESMESINNKLNKIKKKLATI